MDISSFKPEDNFNLNTDVNDNSLLNITDLSLDISKYPPSFIINILSNLLKISFETPFINSDEGPRPIFIKYKDLINFFNDSQSEKRALIWFKKEMFPQIRNLKTSRYICTKIYVILNSVLQNYVHECCNLHLFKNRKWLLDLISIVFSLLIMKLDIVISKEECILAGVPIARSCTKLFIEKITKYQSYETISTLNDFLNAFSDFLVYPNGPDDFSNIYKLLDLLLFNKDYVSVENDNVVYRLYSRFSVDLLRNILNDVTKTTLIYGILEAVDDFFGEHTGQRNQLAEDLWIRLNIAIDHILNIDLIKLDKSIIISDILKKYRDLNNGIFSAKFINLSFENLYLDISKLENIFTQATFIQNSQKYFVKEIDNTSVFGRLKYRIVKYIILNTLDYICKIFMKKFAQKDSQLDFILLIYTWRTIAFFEEYLYDTSFDKTTVFSNEEMELFNLATNFQLELLDDPNSKDIFVNLEKEVLKIDRVVIIPTDWSILLSLLMSSPITDLKDILSRRYNHLDEAYAICYSSAKAIFISFKQIYYLTTNNTEKYEDHDNSIIMANYLENIIQNYLNLENIGEKVWEIYQRLNLNEYPIEGLLKIQLFMQALYEIQYPNEQINFINDNISAQNMFDDLSFSAWPESLFIMTMLTGNQNTISYIFPWFTVINKKIVETDSEKKKKKKKPFKKALVRQLYKEYLTGGSHITNNNLELFGV